MDCSISRPNNGRVTTPLWSCCLGKWLATKRRYFDRAETMSVNSWSVIVAAIKPAPLFNASFYGTWVCMIPSLLSAHFYCRFSNLQAQSDKIHGILKNAHHCNKMVALIVIISTITTAMAQHPHRIDTQRWILYWSQWWILPRNPKWKPIKGYLRLIIMTSP